MGRLTVEGTYENGKIELAEIPAGVQRSRVIVTFVPNENENGSEIPTKSGRKREVRNTLPVTDEDRYPQALRTEYQDLIVKKLHRTLTQEDAIRLDRVRYEINQLDRQSASWTIQKEQAAFIDQELAEIRAELEALPDA